MHPALHCLLLSDVKEKYLLELHVPYHIVPAVLIDQGLCKVVPAYFLYKSLIYHRLKIYHENVIDLNHEALDCTAFNLHYIL